MRTWFKVLTLLTLWVVSSDAWFWPWSGAGTTLAPTLELEGSGIATGSGEPPSENSTTGGAEIIDDGPVLRMVAQTWDETTKGPGLATVLPSAQPERGHGAEATSAGTSSSHRSTAGNDTSSLTVVGSGESDHEGLGLRSELDTESSLLSGSKAVCSTKAEMGLGSKIEKEGVIPNDIGGGSLSSEKRKFHQEASTINYRSNSNPEPLNQNLPSRLEPDQNSNENKDLPTGGSFLPTTIKEATATQVPVGTNKATLPQALQTSHHSLPKQTFSSLATTQTPKQKIFTKRPDTDVPATAIQHEISSPELVIDATRPSIREQQLSQAFLSEQAVVENQTDVAESVLANDSSQCLVLDSALPFCSSMPGAKFAVPNYFDHSSEEKVRALLDEWAWLLRSRCHHAVEWFFCLLSVPKCGPTVTPPVLPCRSFCEALRDSCWTLLDEGHLPVECRALPDEDDGYQCVSVCNRKGNRWLKMNHIWVHFEPKILFYPVLHPHPAKQTLISTDYDILTTFRLFLIILTY